MVLLAV